MASSFSGSATNLAAGGMRFLHCVPSATTATISGITQADPAVVTATAHGLSSGDRVRITGVGGMTELNGRDFLISVVDANSFQLVGEDSSSYTAYTSGGTATLYTVTDLGYTDEGSTLTIEQIYRDRLADQDGQSIIDRVAIGEKISLSVTLREVTASQLQRVFPGAGLQTTARVESGGELAATRAASDNAFLLILHPLDQADTSISGEFAIFRAHVTGQTAIPLGHAQDVALQLTIEGLLDDERPRGQRLWRYTA